MSKAGTDKSKPQSTVWKENKRPLPGSVRKIEIPAKEPVNDSVSGTINTEKVTPDSQAISIMPVSPKKQSKKPSGHGSDKLSFQQYEESTIDAWDDGDDDLLVRLKLDSHIVQSAANQVIRSHNQGVASDQDQDKQETKPLEKDLPVKYPKSQKPHEQQNGSNKANRCISENQSKREQVRQQKFEALLYNPPTKNLQVLEELRTLSWSGVPSIYRPMTWKILCGYLPVAMERREQVLDRKRKEYFGVLDHYYGTRHQAQYQDTFRQIHIDVPRMNPLIALFQQKVVQEMFERVLYIWAIRHPASGYVQGINDLVTPFFVVFLSEYVDVDIDCQNVDISGLSEEQLKNLEADCYWCMSKLLDGIQDNYTFAQPGIQNKVAALRELTLRIDNNLYNHIESHGIEFLQFTFRWMNNLLMRELPLRCTIRLWDTYLAEPDGFANYHLYVCAAFLTRFSKRLQNEKDFQGLMTTLQNLPTQNWFDSEIEELTADAYRLKYTFADAPQHLKPKS